jgi:diketogulonate reductase-like aldo/keto reductase
MVASMALCSFGNSLLLLSGLYYLHHRSEQSPIEDAVGAMADLHRAGKMRALGLSNVTVLDCYGSEDPTSRMTWLPA